MLVEWFRDSESNCFGILDALPLSDTIARERVTLMMVLLRKMKAHLEDTVATGVVSAQRMNELLEMEGR